MAYQLEDRITFGQHIGTKVKTMLDHSDKTRGYITWALRTVKEFSLTKEAYKYYKNQLDISKNKRS